MLWRNDRVRNLVIGFISAGVAAAASPALAVATPDNAETAAIVRQLLAGNPQGAIDAADVDAMRTFYAARDDRPVWVDENGPTRAASLLAAELGRAEQWGLAASDFKLDAASAPRGEAGWTPEQTAKADIELTARALRYARHARGGRIPDPETQLSSYLDRRPSLPDDADVLARLTRDPRPDEILISYQPKHAQFLKLKHLYATLRAQSQAPQSAKIAAQGPALVLGMQNADVAVLNKRFEIATEPGKADVFEAPLVAAIKKYQASVSLRADGIIGRATRKALNADAGSNQVRAVLANMEEWRWMPDELGVTHVFVNVPDYAIEFVNAGQTEFRDRVIVGEQDKQTPIFSKSMMTIVIRPEWNLPDSIKLSKLLAASSGGRSLESQGYVIKKNNRTVSSTSVDWSKANLSAYRIYQPSGDDNALGSVKFLFPNKHSVYLHDTPSKSLFDASERLFSHGCVRVRNPLSLAQFILDADRGNQAPAAAVLARKGPFNNQITLDAPIPVHIGYFTVWVDDDGQARFLDDPYGHQERIALALENKWDQIEKGEDHLAAVDTSGLKVIGVRARAPLPFDAPSGVTTVSEPAQYRPSRASVGDIIRNAITN